MKYEILRSIIKEPSATSGFSVVEVVLSAALFALIVTAMVGGYLYGQESTALAGSRSRATFLAEEGLEALRNLRDANFTNLANGSHGLTDSGGSWALSGTSDSNGIFTRTVTIGSLSATQKQATSTVIWQQNQQRQGTVILSTIFTNWQATAAPPASCNDYAVGEGYTLGTCRANVNQCNQSGETYLSDGDPFCTGGGSADTCCALP